MAKGRNKVSFQYSCPAQSRRDKSGSDQDNTSAPVKANSRHSALYSFPDLTRKECIKSCIGYREREKCSAKDQKLRQPRQCRVHKLR